MKKISSLAMGGLLSLGLLAGACSSGGGSGTGSGGSTGSAGSGGSTGNAGSTGSAGSGGSTGTAGTGGTTTAAGCQVSDPAPTNGIIADFDVDGGLGIMGGFSAYGGTAVPAPTYSTTGGNLMITLNGTADTAAQYVGVVIYFNPDTAGTHCLDASAFTGVQFDLMGSVTGCTVQYSTNDSAHTAMSVDDAKAGGPAGSYSPQATLTAAQITSTSMTIMMPFTGAGAPSGGSPSTVAFDPSKLEGVQWQFTVMPSMTCDASLTIDNVKFY